MQMLAARSMPLPQAKSKRKPRMARPAPRPAPLLLMLLHVHKAAAQRAAHCPSRSEGRPTARGTRPLV
eukprot:7366766-Prymnesium_polylepis.1